MNRRVLVMSQRGLRSHVSRCSAYEFEDIVCELESAEMVVPTPRLRAEAFERLVGNVQRRARLPWKSSLPYRCDVPAGEADLLMAIFQGPRDALSLGGLPEVASLASQTVCILEEVYSAEVEELAPHVRAMAEFDWCFTANPNSLPELERVSGRAWHYLPFGVDALSFAPRSVTSRCIDVTNIGRRSAVTHGALVDWARQNERFYYFDSYGVGPCLSATEHRLLLSRLLQSSQIAISNRGVGARPGHTKHQEALAYRFFEAAAAGATMVGARPAFGEFDELFDWPDAHFDVPFDAPDIAEFIESLLAQPDRLAVASQRSIVESLRRHDHSARWRQVLETMGLETTAAHVERAAALQQAASAFVS